MGLDLSSIGSSLVSNVVNFAEQRYFNKTQNAFAKGMADTQYQRGAADLKAAGINPVLAYASPDATPSGASGTASWSDPVPVAQGVSSAKAAQKVAEEQALLTNTQQELVARQSQAQLYENTAVDAETKARAKYADAMEEAKLMATLAAAKASIGSANNAEASARINKVEADLVEKIGPIGKGILENLPGLGGSAKTLFDISKGLGK